MLAALRAVLVLASLASAAPGFSQVDPLPSWNEGRARDAIIDFVTAVTTEGADDYLPPEERIAVFDNDGTLWTEQPIYFELFFSFERLRALAPAHPEWTTLEPYKSALAGDAAAVAAGGGQGLVDLIALTHGGMEEAVFLDEVRRWLATARHPRFDRPFTDLVFQPMLELMDYLRDHGFETWIVSGGGLDFMRAWTEGAYGVPPQQVVGSQMEVTFQVVGDEPGFLRAQKMAFHNDGPGKPVGILRHVGRRPVAAFGNSDGDYEMLRYTSGFEEAHLAMIVHHTDGAREYAYDRDSDVGRLDRALDAAPDFGWILIDMAKDWRRIYPFDP